MIDKQTVSISLSHDDLRHLRWALEGFHQQIPTTDPVKAQAARIDLKLRDGLVALGSLAS